MGLLDLFMSRADPERKPEEAPPAPRAVWYSNRLGKSIVVYDSVCTAAYALQHPIIQRALRTIARAVQQATWFAELDPDDKTPVASGVVEELNALLKSPNNDYTGSMLKFWLGLSLAVYDRAAFKVGMGVRSPNGIYPLDAEFLKLIINKRGRIDGYRYGMVGNEETYPIRDMGRAQPKGWGYAIMTPTLSGDLTDDKTVLNQLRSLGGPAKLVEMLMKRALATAGGATNSKVIITTTSTNLTDQQMDEIGDYIEDHDTFGAKSGETIFLQDVELKVHTIDSDLSDIHSKMPADDMTRLIFGAYGIPIALVGLGAADAAKFAGNYSESHAAFYTDTVIPEYLTPIAEGMTKALCPAGVRIVFDIDSIPAIQQRRIESMAKMKDVDFLTVAEKREMFGFSPNGGPTNAPVA